MDNIEMEDEFWASLPIADPIRDAKRQAKFENKDRKAAKLKSMKQKDLPIFGLQITGHETSREDLQPLWRALRAERDRIGEVALVTMYQDWIQNDYEVNMIAQSEGDPSLDASVPGTASQLGKHYEELANRGGKRVTYGNGEKRMIREIMPTMSLGLRYFGKKTGSMIDGSEGVKILRELHIRTD